MKLADHVGKAFKEWALTADPVEVGDIVVFLKTETTTPFDILRLSERKESDHPFRRGER